MKKRLSKLIDVKSIITITLVAVLVVIVVRNASIDEKIFNLYSNITTMVMTYFFVKKTNGGDDSGTQN